MNGHSDESVVGVLFIALAFTALIVGAGWVLFVEIPNFAAEKAVCYERGGAYVGSIDTVEGRGDGGCYRLGERISTEPRAALSQQEPTP